MSLAARDATGKQTIALVDDDRNILASVSMALEAEGFKVRDDEESLVKLSRQSRDQLEKLVAIDRGNARPEREEGWGD